MPSSDEPVYATDAETSMRAAAKLVLQCVAAGYSRSEILSSLEKEKIFLPDPESFIDTVIRVNSSKDEPEIDLEEGSSTRTFWYVGAGIATAVALGGLLLILLG